MKTKPCPECGAMLLGAKALKTHRELLHHLHCSICDRKFPTAEEMQFHFRESPAHPKCTRCNQGFEDADGLEIHRLAHHQFVDCLACAIVVSVDGLDDHYLTSANHPSCTVCSLGFKDAFTFGEHCNAKHSNLFCAACGELFESSLMRDLHFFLSPAHPKCYLCQRAFQDDAAMSNHACGLAKRVFQQFRPSAAEGTSTAEPQKAYAVASGTAIQPRRSKSPIEPHACSSAHSLTPPGAPRSAASTPPDPSRQERLAQASAYIDRYLSDQLASPPLAGGRLPRSARLGRVSESDSDGSISDLDEEEEEEQMEDADAREGGSGLQSGGMEPITPMSALRQGLPRQDATHASQTSPIPQTLIEGVRPVSHIYCRICRRDPCDEPTATMCGHVFCRRCITAQVAKTSRCPMCQSATLLYSLILLHIL